jgi:hypothetical protein
MTTVIMQSDHTLICIKRSFHFALHSELLGTTIETLVVKSKLMLTIGRIGRKMKIREQNPCKISVQVINVVAKNR